MNTSALLFLCLFGVSILNQGRCKPDEEADGYLQDEEDEVPEEEDAGPPPKMISKSATFQVDIGGTIQLPCELDRDTSSFSRIWRRKGAQGLYVGTMAQTNDPRFRLLSNGVLEIHQLDLNDEGDYTCMISADEKVIYTVEIKTPAKITDFQPRESPTLLKQHSSLTLKCIAGIGKPTPDVKWFKNGHLLDRKKQEATSNFATYIITNATSEDSGLYKCTADNKLQAMPDSRVIEIQVTSPPEVKIAEGEDIVPTGDGYESELRCIVTGPKNSKVKWYKDDVPVEPSKAVKLDKKGSSHYLKIHHTKAADFGNYKCVAKNAEGESSAIIQLTGKPKPVYKKFDTDKETNNPVITFNTTSYAALEEYELLYKKQEDNEWRALRPSPTVSNPEEGTNVYVLEQVISGLDPGVYVAKLKAKNSLGWSEYSTEIEFPKEHEGDIRHTGGLLAAGSSSAELRISLALLISLLVARFYC